MFNLPEEEKIKFCERHRILGNHLFEEGLLPKAAEQYQTVVDNLQEKRVIHTTESGFSMQALSFYEYCFPEDDAAQHSLDLVRYASLCNISLCYSRMGFLREAEEMATQVITINKLSLE